MFVIALLSPFTAPAISPRAISCGYPMGPRSKAALSHFVQAKTLAVQRGTGRGNPERVIVENIGSYLIDVT
jgi:hypothetical protein